MPTYKTLDKAGKRIFTDVTLHPGEVLSDEINARKIKQKDFAKKIKLLAPHFNDLLKGKRHISARIALKLEKELDIEADYWLRLQMNYDLAIAKKAMQKELQEE
ncbi:MAG: HigA family addiction module antitoxin [Ferruginibacter sp.]